MQNEIMVEVAYALPKEQLIIPVRVPTGTTAEDAIKLSGILQKYPEIDLAVNKFGIFGKLTKPDAVLRELDRVEIYRGLTFDPKESRRRRAEHRRAKTARNGRVRPAGLL